MRYVMLIKILPWAPDIHNCIISYTHYFTQYVFYLVALPSFSRTQNSGQFPKSNFCRFY
jgi:hypothetical protein